MTEYLFIKPGVQFHQILSVYTVLCIDANFTEIQEHLIYNLDMYQLFYQLVLEKVKVT